MLIYFNFVIKLFLSKFVLHYIALGSSIIYSIIYYIQIIIVNFGHKCDHIEKT